jgi:hypothetical protein
MTHLMAVLFNGVAQIEFDRTKPLPEYQGAFLARMDRKMDTQGIEVDGASIPGPDLLQKARFVAGNLAHAIVTDQEAQAAALTTWLAVRLPELKQLKIVQEDAGFAIELDFEHDYVKQYPVTFTPWKRH